MGREVRRVPKDWQHPKDEKGGYIPLYGSDFDKEAKEWDEEKWDAGEFPDYASERCRKFTFEEWDGKRPNPEDYMPVWKDEECTHFMMYENTSEGTPISPAFETPEELARWLVDNKVSAFARTEASYEGWLRVAKGGYAPSMIVHRNELINGVDAL